jgi:hypothetical protein
MSDGAIQTESASLQVRENVRGEFLATVGAAWTKCSGFHIVYQVNF